ncbi:RluA family pseudouridine synthase [Candidatus Falkowbacteria bacterium]|nr:RluA family pseudouridine synthase [Candidatus Falkowbacteria bacterium]
MIFKITIKHAGERLDKFLANNLSNLSRNQIQKLIKEGGITVNDKPATPHHALKDNDIIYILKQKSEISEQAKPAPNQMLPRIDVIADTKEYLVINKPAGLITHGAPHIQEITLADVLLKQYPLLEKIGENRARPGIVHRLDKEASGLLAIAKSQGSFENLKKQFQKRTVDKKYIALVYGPIIKEEGIINFPLKRAANGHKIAAIPATIKGKLSSEGREAVTEFKVIKKFINYTLLEIKIKTGRTHQIRAHLAAYGHPIVGDNLYGTPKIRLKNKKINLGRIFLAANELSFTDLSGERKNFKIDLPQDLKNFLNTIK